MARAVACALLLLRGFHLCSTSIVTDEGCFSCLVPNQSDVLSIASYASMCPESDLWGIELTTAFVTQRMIYNIKFWQGRTVEVRDTFGVVHHIFLPFILNSGGLSVMVGHAAVAVLRKAGATAKSNGSLDYCNLNVPLPLKAVPCVTKWDTPTPGAADHDQGHDIREFHKVPCVA